MRALLVEDDPDVSADVATALTANGFIVECAQDGRQAWFLGDTEDYDVCVLDLGLPSMDGLSVLRRWRSAGRTPHSISGSSTFSRAVRRGMR